MGWAATGLQGANPDANRYWIQTRDDRIDLAQFAGGLFHGGDPDQMGVTRLESGFLNHEDGGTLVSGHSSYFAPDSTSMRNMRAVIQGQDVYPFIEKEILQYTERGAVMVDPLKIRPDDFAGDKMVSEPSERTQR